ncbi:MAG: sugar ABC transporter permease [Anaeromyxobacter sp.]|nr:sugar ABC transporter permease [Anaeromyxobacter sp.]MBL0275837.1 sugar ABC transporter permease [Anaeromyxobacter sp.]
MLLAVGGAALLVRGALGEAAEEVATRRAVVTLRSLEALVVRAGLRGEPVRALLQGWQAGQPAGTEARVVLGTALEASTAAADAGEAAAPRRLGKDEKPLYDQWKRLGSNLAGNAEGGSPKPELEIERLQSGGRELAAPLLEDGQVVGLVRVTTPPPPPTAPPSPLIPLVYVLAPVAALFVATRRGTPRRGGLLLASLAFLAVSAAGFGSGSVERLAQAARDGTAAVAEQAREQGALAAALLASQGLAAEPALQPGLWDVGLDRRPRGLLTPAGEPDEAAVDEVARAARGDARGSALAAGLVGLLVLLLSGLGAFAAGWRALRQHRQAYAYVAPALIGTTVLVFFPFFYGVVLSFTDSNIYNTSAPLSELWVGLKNYAAILGDFGIARRGEDGALVWNYLNFYWTFLFTIVWTVTNVTFGVSFGLLLALILNTKGLALRPFYRVVLILPWAMPNYITALIWKGMFHRQFGVVNQALALFGVEPMSWFDKPFTSFMTALATNGWLSFPFMMVVSLGALQSIPADIYEAARVDGATRWQQFKAITLPSLRPALVPAVILSVVWTFNMFNIIYLVTAGAPEGATEILITQAYKFAFERYRYGYAAAYSVVIFAILLVYGTFQNRVTRATEAI